MKERVLLSNQKNAGFAFAILDMITYGLLPIYSHYFVKTIDPLLFGGVSTLVGSIPLIAYLKYKNQEKELYSKNYIKSLLAISVILTVSSILFFVGTNLTSGLNTGLLIQLEPIYGILFGSIFLAELVTVSQFFSASLMILGSIIIIYRRLGGINIGDLLIFLVPILNQIGHIPAKKIINQISNVNTIPAARLFYGGIILTLIAIIVNPASIYQLKSIDTWLAIIFFGIIFRCIDTLLWYQAIKRIDLSKAASVIPLSVVVSLIGSILILHENITIQQLLGALLIITGLIWLSLISNKKKVGCLLL